MVKLAVYDINRLCDYLEGTCKSLNEACSDLDIDVDDLTTEQLEGLDGQVFCCATCGWWSEVADMGQCADGELTCRECENENA